MLSWKKLGDLSWKDKFGIIQPLAAASGLVQSNGFLWIAADDLHHLIHIPLNGSFCGKGYQIFPGDLPAEKTARKKLKPDTEALFEIFWKGEKVLIIFPSGSKSHRTRGAMVKLDSQNLIKSSEIIDFSELIQYLDQEIQDLNIEGATVWNDKLILLQRGNGKSGINAVIGLNFADFMNSLNGTWHVEKIVSFVHQVHLPELGGIPLTFTDCKAFKSEIYFAAAAEGGKDTYLDGEVKGSALGKMNQDFKPEILGTIEHLKVEGIAILTAENNQLEFLLVTDADDPQIPSQLLSAKMT